MLIAIEILIAIILNLANCPTTKIQAERDLMAVVQDAQPKRIVFLRISIGQ